jgi:hypothetical protein
MGCTPLYCRKRQLGSEAEQQLKESTDPCVICRKHGFNSSEKMKEVRTPALRSGQFPSRIDCVMR